MKAQTTPLRDNPNALTGAIVGLGAGLLASLAMDGFQAALSALSPPQEGAEPATQKAADRLAKATTGAAVAEASKPLAGEVVHYALGSALGLAYGVAAEYAPAVTSGVGALFGLGTAALLDETAVPATGLGEPPWKTPATTHAYTLSSHLVFGVTIELTRRLLRKALTSLDER